MHPTSRGPVSGGSDARLLAALRAGAQPPRPPHPSHPSGSDLVPGATSPAGAVPLSGADPFAVAALMDRHWQPVHDYVSLFAPPSASGRSAALVTAAAFAEALEELRRHEPGAGGGTRGGTGSGAGAGAGEGAGAGAGAGYDGALRVAFLTAAGRVLRRWAGDGRVAALLPGVRRPAGPADDRRLVALAFRSLPAPAQVLLWHREVEGEGLSIPAALLGTDPRDAAERLGEARELLRARCVSAHHELAPDAECRHYGRLLDISLRRTGPLIPDIRRHLAGCAHCRYAAEQLRQFDGRLPLLLAEAVLGEGAGRYVDSRPARRRLRGGMEGGRGRRAARRSRALGGRLAAWVRRVLGGRLAAWVRRAGLRVPGGGFRGAVAPGAGGGYGATRPAGGPGPAPGRGGATRVPVVAVAAAGLAGALVLTALAAALWPGGGDAEPSGRRAPGAGASVPGAAGGPVPVGSQASVPAGSGPAVPGTSPPARPVSPPPAGPGAPTGEGDLRTRLRSAGAAGLCLDVRDGTPGPGAEVTLARCSGALTQVWSYGPDGALRSAAAPHLCPDAGRPEGTVALTACAASGAAVRYDITLQGVIVPRHGTAALALAPLEAAAGAPVVVRVRDGAPLQRWHTDTPAR
ncbi:ricin-type beta-trefoil lectin domain protein [Streptomyces sp. enrichment culture]|uniref:ricin-type beta-trefoil lectin domain protein n=1 Tax=Streptomyces sp. enrichment culture TaxID=1795815 RepID=UPI003F579868